MRGKVSLMVVYIALKKRYSGSLDPRNRKSYSLQQTSQKSLIGRATSGWLTLLLTVYSGV